MMEADRDALLALERKRCDAIARGDAATLQALLTDDYVHVHMTGKVDDRAGHIRAVAARPRTPERGPLTVRLYGEVAVLTGELTNRTPAGAGQPERRARLLPASRGQAKWRLADGGVTTDANPGHGVTKAGRAMAGDGDDVIDLERRRCAAIGAGDLTALAEILADDYQHVMGTGVLKDKAAYIDTIRNGPRVPERGDLTVRLYGNAAVVIGDIINRITYPGQPTRVINATVTQVAVKSAGRWQFVSFQITPKRDSV